MSKKKQSEDSELLEIINLKAQAYDLIIAKDQITNRLQQVGNLINQKSKEYSLNSKNERR